MKLTQTPIMAVAAMVSGAKAQEFYLFGDNSGGPFLDQGFSYAVHNSLEPSCDEVGDAVMWRKSDDVSGGKWGIRTERKDEEMRVCEMNFNAKGFHWTWYKDGDDRAGGTPGEIDEGVYRLTDGKRIGNCRYIEGGKDKEVCCNLGVGKSWSIPVLKCQVGYTADDIDANQPSHGSDSNEVWSLV